MMKNKMLNRRFVGLELSKTVVSISQLVETVDNYILNSYNLDQLTQNIFIYGISENLFVGREVIGTDSQLKHHSELILKDFPASFFELLEVEINSFQEAVDIAKQRDFDFFRIELDFNNLFKAKIYFLESLEK